MVETITFLLIGALLYFLPTLIGKRKKNRPKLEVFLRYCITIEQIKSVGEVVTGRRRKPASDRCRIFTESDGGFIVVGSYDEIKRQVFSKRRSYMGFITKDAH